MSLTDYTQETEQETLFKFFGDTLKKKYDGENFASYRSDEWAVNVYRSWESLLFCVDLVSCYNKDSQCPICFEIETDSLLSRRKEKRIFGALNYLLANKKIAGTFWSSLPDFDDLGQHVRTEFLRNKY